MAKQQQIITFIFDDPNTPKAFAQHLHKILIDKLLSIRKDTSTSFFQAAGIR